MTTDELRKLRSEYMAGIRRCNTPGDRASLIGSITADFLNYVEQCDRLKGKSGCVAVRAVSPVDQVCPKPVTYMGEIGD